MVLMQTCLSKSDNNSTLQNTILRLQKPLEIQFFFWLFASTQQN